MWSWLHTCRPRAHRHVWCDISKWTDDCIGAQSPPSANNGTWGKLFALSKSLHLLYHNLMIIVKMNAISQGYCEMQILRYFKLLGKYQRHAWGYEAELADPRYSILFLIVFSLYSIAAISQSCVYSYPSVLVNHKDQLYTSCHFSV